MNPVTDLAIYAVDLVNNLTKITFSFTKPTGDIGGYYLYMSSTGSNYTFIEARADAVHTQLDTDKTYDESGVTYFEYQFPDNTNDGKLLYFEVQAVSITWDFSVVSNVVTEYSFPSKPTNPFVIYDGIESTITWNTLDFADGKNVTFSNYNIYRDVSSAVNGSKYDTLSTSLYNLEFTVGLHVWVIDRFKRVQWFGAVTTAGYFPLDSTTKLTGYSDNSYSYTINIDNFLILKEYGSPALLGVSSTGSYTDASIEFDKYYIYNVSSAALGGRESNTIKYQYYTVDVSNAYPYLRPVENSSTGFFHNSSTGLTSTGLTSTGLLQNKYWAKFKSVLIDSKYYDKTAFAIPYAKNAVYSLKGFLGVSNCVVDVYVNEIYSFTTSTGNYGEFTIDYEFLKGTTEITLECRLFRNNSTLKISRRSAPYSIRTFNIYSFYSALGEQYEQIEDEADALRSDISIDDCRYTNMEDRYAPFTGLYKQADEDETKFRAILKAAFQSFEYASFDQSIEMILDAFNDNVDEFDHYEIYYNNSLYRTKRTGQTFTCKNPCLTRDDYYYGISAITSTGEETPVSVVRTDRRWWPATQYTSTGVIVTSTGTLVIREETTIRTSTGSDIFIYNTIDTEAYPYGCCYDGNNLWVALPGKNAISKIDIDTQAILLTASTGLLPVDCCYNGSYIWVINSGDNTVSKINISDGATIEVINVGSTPRGCCVSPFHIWVTNYDDGTLSRINNYSNVVTNTINVGNNPYDCCYANNNVWVTNFTDNTVSRVNILSNTEEVIIPVGQSPTGICFDGTYIWVTNSTDNTISKIDINSDTVITSTGVGSTPMDCCYYNNYVWVANYNDSTVSTIETSTGTIIKTTSTGTYPIKCCPVDYGICVTNYNSIGSITRISRNIILVTSTGPVTRTSTGIVVYSDPSSIITYDNISAGDTPYSCCYYNGFVYVTNAVDDTVSKIDTATDLVTATISVGADPIGITYGANYIWVTNSDDNTVSKIDPATDLVVDTITVGAYPAFSYYANNYIWVTNFDDNTVLKIDPVTDIVVNTIPVGLSPAFCISTNNYLYVVNISGNSISKIDLVTDLVVSTITVGNTPYGIAYDGTYLWITYCLGNTISKFDPITDTIISTITVGTFPFSISFDGTYLWLFHARSSNNVYIINPTTEVIEYITTIGLSPINGCFDGNYMWITDYPDSHTVIKAGYGTVGTAGITSTGIVTITDPGYYFSGIPGYYNLDYSITRTSTGYISSTGYVRYNVLLWDAEPDADAYNIYRGTTSTDLYKINSILGTVFVDGNYTTPDLASTPRLYNFTDMDIPKNISTINEMFITKYIERRKQTSCFTILIFEKNNKSIPEIQITRIRQLLSLLIPPELKYTILVSNDTNTTLYPGGEID